MILLENDMNDVAGTRMREESVDLRNEETIRRNMVFPLSLRELIRKSCSASGEGFAEWVRNACRQRLENE